MRSNISQPGERSSPSEDVVEYQMVLTLQDEASFARQSRNQLDGALTSITDLPRVRGGVGRENS